MPSIEKFGDERRSYNFFEIKNENLIFLKDGILKRLAEVDFDTLRDNLDSKYANQAKGNFLCSLEEKWQLGQVLKVDVNNPYISENGGTLYFFFDGVLMAKNANATLVHADKTLLRVLATLIRKIKDGMQLDFSSL